MQSRIPGLSLQMKLLNIEVKTMEQNPTTQKHETNECRCARCESRDKDMKEFYMVRMED
jgi:hypothetical protein